MVQLVITERDVSGVQANHIGCTIDPAAGLTAVNHGSDLIQG